MIQFVEKDIEDLIMDSCPEKVRARGLDRFEHDAVFRQVNLGAYGIADIIGINFFTPEDGRTKVSSFTIYELKKDAIGFSAFGQVARYAKGLKEYCRKEFAQDYVECYMVLIGSELELNSNFVYAANEAYPLACYTYKLSLEGLLFEKHDLDEYNPASLKDKGFGALDKIVFTELFKISSQSVSE
jgi:hypothetical protein